jgi:hypothetical protein
MGITFSIFNASRDHPALIFHFSWAFKVLNRQNGKAGVLANTAWQTAVKHY